MNIKINKKKVSNEAFFLFTFKVLLLYHKEENKYNLKNEYLKFGN